MSPFLLAVAVSGAQINCGAELLSGDETSAAVATVITHSNGMWLDAATPWNTVTALGANSQSWPADCYALMRWAWVQLVGGGTHCGVVKCSGILEHKTSGTYFRSPSILNQTQNPLRSIFPKWIPSPPYPQIFPHTTLPLVCASGIYSTAGSSRQA